MNTPCLPSFPFLSGFPTTTLYEYTPSPKRNPTGLLNILMFVCRSTDRAADLIAIVTGIQTEADHIGPTTDWRPSDSLQEGSLAEQDSSVRDDNPGTELYVNPTAAFTATAEYIRGLVSFATATLTGIPQ